MTQNTAMLVAHEDYLQLAIALGMRGWPSGDQLYCRCPLHLDRSASFSLNLSTGLWTCHAGCGSGEFRTLVVRALECSLVEAVEWLQANSTVMREMPIERHIDAPTVALDARYAAALEALPRYWFERGYTWQDALQWGVRYEPATERLVIPHYAPRLVGLVLRTVVGATPKYLHSPGFPKRETLFGYTVQPSADAILLVEGPLDVIAAARHGYVAYATFGAHISPLQLALLAARPTIRYLVAYDADPAGREAARNVGVQLLRVGLDSVRAFRYPAQRKDIGECTQAEVTDGIESSTTIAALF